MKDEGTVLERLAKLHARLEFLEEWQKEEKEIKAKRPIFWTILFVSFIFSIGAVFVPWIYNFSGDVMREIADTPSARVNKTSRQTPK